MSTSETAPNVPSSNVSSTDAAPPARPSWETARLAPAAPRPAAPVRRPAPAASAPQQSPQPPASAYQPASISPPSPGEDIKYDLSGNPIPGSGAASTPLAPPAPFGYSAGPGIHPAGPASGAWPPPVGGAQVGHGAQAYRNNSGEQSHLPPEIERLRWHWGAFFFPILWTKKHGLTTIASVLTGGLIFLRVLRYVFAAINPALFFGICAFYVIAYFALQMYGGLNGHKIGWRNRHFPGGVEEYFKVQSAWMWWGFGINFVAVPLLWFGFFAAIIGAALTAHHAAPSSYSSGSYNGSGGSAGQ